MTGERIPSAFCLAADIVSLQGPSSADAPDENEADAREIYAAVKPSGDEPELTGNPPELKAKLHSYQRRSAAWMVHRETIPQVRPQLSALMYLEGLLLGSLACHAFEQRTT